MKRRLGSSSLDTLQCVVLQASLVPHSSTQLLEVAEEEVLPLGVDSRSNSLSSSSSCCAKGAARSCTRSGSCSSGTLCSGMGELGWSLREYFRKLEDRRLEAADPAPAHTAADTAART